MPPPLSTSASSSNVVRAPNPRYPDQSKYPLTPDPEEMERRYSAATALESFEMQVLHSSIFDESMAQTRLRMMKIVAGLPTDATQPPISWRAHADRTAEVSQHDRSGNSNAGPSAPGRVTFNVDDDDDEVEAGPSRAGPSSSSAHRRSGRAEPLDQLFEEDE